MSVRFQIDPMFMPSETEERTVFGLKLKQKRNTAVINGELFKTAVSKANDVSGFSAPLLPPPNARLVNADDAGNR